jgi:hypothetical protein
MENFVKPVCVVTLTWVVRWLRLAIFKGPKTVGVSPLTRTETDPVYETLCFLWRMPSSGAELPAHAGSSLADFSTLKMEAIRSSETSVQSTTSTRPHTPEDGIIHSHRSENLKSYILCFLVSRIQDDGKAQNQFRKELFFWEQKCILLPYQCLAPIQTPGSRFMNGKNL